MLHRKAFSPLTWPVILFALVILLGAALLASPLCWKAGQHVPVVDALFLSTSAVCVTGLATLDVGSVFNGYGLLTMLILIQLGGLGITTYTSLIFLLWRHKVPFTDRTAVSQALLNNSDFDLASFLRHVIFLVIFIEGLSAVILYLADPVVFHPFSAIFHSISAFCNAGFGLLPSNLISFQDNITVNMVIMVNIIAGGIGFSVLRECISVVRSRLRGGKARLGRYSILVLLTSGGLILGGGGLIWLIEVLRDDAPATGFSLVLVALFQSVSARTAGFCSVDMTTLTDASLLVLVVLMFIGGSPGSCAGGIKTTTFRVLVGFISAQLRGDKQIVIGQRAVYTAALTRALTLFFFSAVTVCVSVILLSLTENGLSASAGKGNVPLLAILFEVVSALGTVGLSMNLTPELSAAGKIIITLNMFIGRVGLITLLMALQSFRSTRNYEYPSMYTPIG
ncbi:MAG: potassium transporter TrkG [Desulfovibrionaceae bacterium]